MQYQRDLDVQTAGGQTLPIIPTRIGVMDVLSRTWEIYKGKLGPVILGVIAVTMLQQGSSFALQMLAPAVRAATGSEVAGVVVMGMGQLFNFVFSQWLALGLILYLLKLGRGQEANFGDVFSGGPHLISALVAMLLFGLAIVPVALIGLAIGGGAYLAIGESPVTAVIIVITSLICVVPIVYISLMFSQFQYLIVDRGVSAMESLRLSRVVTEGNKVWILLLGILAGLITMVGVFACCVGVVFTAPYAMFAYTICYLVMTGQPTAEQVPSGEAV